MKIIFTDIKCAFQAAFWLLGSGVSLSAEPLYEAAISKHPSAIILDAKIADADRKVVLDTGADLTIVDESISWDLGAPVARSTMKFPGGEKLIHVYRSPAIMLGPILLPNSSVGAADLEMVRIMTGQDTTGIIGLDSLVGLTLHIDYDEGVLRLSQGSAKDDSNWESLPLKKAVAEPTVNVILEASFNEAPVDFIIDLGLNLAMSLSDQQFEALVADGWVEEAEQGEGLSLGGAHAIRAGVFAKGRFLGVELKDMSVNGHGTANLLGRNFLAYLNFKIDMESDKFYFQRNRVTDPINVQQQLSIGLLYSRGQAVVARVKPGGKAEKAGFMKGDVITNLGPLATGSINEIAVYKLCEEFRNSTIQVSLIRAGKRTNLPLDL